MHGHEFAVLGNDEQLDWHRTKTIERFEVKFKARIGPGKNDDKQVRLLDRIIQWIGGVGVQYEADQRHAEIVIGAAGLQSAKSVSTPGVK